MGGGDKSKAEGEDVQSKNPPSTLVLEGLCEFMKIPVRKTEVTIMAKLRASAQRDEERRAPITICAAIDRSGSMKDHLPLLKETLQFMVQQLRSEDKLCLVTFDHEVCVQLPLTNMDSAGKLHAEKAIESVKERGHTNLSGGLLAALEALYRIPSNEASLVESVLLFTDGKANVGIKDQAPLVKATKSLLNQINRQACVFTFGYGTEHDADLLHAVADAGNGLFYYIDNSDSIPESFCDCLGGLLSVAAQNVKLTLTACGEVTLNKPITTFRTTEKESKKSFEVTIPDVYCEEEKCILAKVSVPVDHNLTEPLTLPLVTCQVDYFDVLNCKPNKIETECTVIRNKSIPDPVNSDSFDEIELHKIRCEVADTLGQANTMAGAGNIAGARAALTRATVRIQDSVVVARPLAVHLLETVKESLTGLEDKDTYKEHGKATLMNYAGSHWQQRSNSKPTAMGHMKHKRAKAMARPPPKPSPKTSAELEEFTSPYSISSKMRMLSTHSTYSQ